MQNTKNCITRSSRYIVLANAILEILFKKRHFCNILESEGLKLMKNNVNDFKRTITYL